MTTGDRDIAATAVHIDIAIVVHALYWRDRLDIAASLVRVAFILIFRPKGLVRMEVCGRPCQELDA